MSQPTKIEWTHWPDGLPGKTWNPVRGCSRISSGCEHCYAERIASRFSGPGEQFFGFATRRVHMFEPTKTITGWTGRVELIESKLDEPLRTRKPARWFVNSMSDLFHESLPDEAIDAVFVAMSMASRHHFLVLTKRAQRMRKYLSQHVEAGRFVGALSRVAAAAPGRKVDLPKWNAIGSVGWELPNVALGVSVEGQATADERIPELLATPAAMRFVSYEPALGPVDFEPWLHDSDCLASEVPFCICAPPREVGLDWIIVGGESGPGARPFDIAWARSTIEQCKAARVPCFVKQLGAFVVSGGCVAPGQAWGRIPLHEDIGVQWRHHLLDRKGGDTSEWPEDLCVREFPAVSVPR